MRLLPRSMAGQLIALLLLALLVAHLIALWVRQGRDEYLHPVASHYMLERVAGVYHAVRLSPPGQSEQMLSTISTGNAQFWLTSGMPDLPVTMNEEEKKLARALSARLSQPPSRSWVQIVDHHSPAVQESGSDSPPYVGILAALELADGRWLVSLQQSVGRSPWWKPLHFSIPVSTLPVLLVAILFIRRILRPIRALETAAERLSRGEQGGPLPVTGPSEARELTMAFNLMEERQNRFLEDRTRMLAAISHDLRSPITSLRLRAEMIDDAALRTVMTNTLEDMSLMVEETLRFARDDTVDQVIEEVDVARLAREIVADFSELGHRISWNGPHGIFYRCRPLSIRRAITNLVDNATRYGSEVEIRGHGTNSKGEVIIEVSDNGPGIDPALFERAFEPFARLDPSRNRETGGAGLGLSIARSCIEAHGGRLELANRPEGGLVARITLPEAGQTK